MRKRKIRSLITCFLILMMVVSFIPEASAGKIKNLSKTVSETPDQEGELEITLTVSGETVSKDQPLNLLLVIDLSGSMNNTLSGGTTRLDALKNAFATNKNNFIDSLQENVGSGNLYVDIVTFASTATNKLAWTNNMTEVKSTINGLKAEGGTNYQDALVKAQAAASEKSDVHVIFLSDGLPTFYGSNGTKSFGNSCSVANLEATLTQMSSYASDPNITFRAAIAYATTPTFTATTRQYGTQEDDVRYQDVNLLGPAGSNVSGTYQKYERTGMSWGGRPTYDWVDDTNQDLETRSIPTIGYNAYQTANNEAELLNSLDKIVKGFHLKSVTITDPMHETHIKELIDLASLHTEGKLKVFLISEDGIEKPLANPTDYTVNESTINYVPELKAGEILKAVATVQVSDSPGAIYFEKQVYPDKDADGKPGFFSNKTASASGTVDQDIYTGNYLNPVFQLNTTSLTIRKVSSADNTQNLAGATFTITRKADSSSTTGVTRSKTSESEDEETISTPITYTTGDDGTVRIPDLPYGYYELTETVPPNGFKILDSPLTFSVDYLGQITTSDERLSNLTGSASDGYSATVTNDPNDVTLTVTKNLEGTAKNATDKFPFTLSAEGINSVSESIGQDESITIEVPYGTTVKVSETDSNGYTATVNTEDGQTPVITDWAKDGNGYSGTITLTKDTEIIITNTKDAPVVTGFITDTSGTSGIALVSITMISLGALLIYLKKRHF